MQKIKFFVLWFLAVSICINLGILLSGPLADFLYSCKGLPYSASNDGFSEIILSRMLLVGLFMGFGQWLAINTKIKRAYGWILATLIGFSVGSFVSFWIIAFMLPVASKYYRVYGWIHTIGTLVGGGMFTGVCQWISLGRKVASSFKWSLIMALSFAIGITLDSLIGSISRNIGPLIFSITIGLISGAFAEPLIIRPEIQQQEIAI